jgi:hypothetical protein
MTGWGTGGSIFSLSNDERIIGFLLKKGENILTESKNVTARGR